MGIVRLLTFSVVGQSVRIYPVGPAIRGIILIVMDVPQALSKAITKNPEILGGTPCFIGTRVPLETFLDYIESGYSLDRFLRGYPSVRREQAKLVLEWLGLQGRISAGLELVS